MRRGGGQTREIEVKATQDFEASMVKLERAIQAHRASVELVQTCEDEVDAVKLDVEQAAAVLRLSSSKARLDAAELHASTARFWADKLAAEQQPYTSTTTSSASTITNKKKTTTKPEGPVVAASRARMEHDSAALHASGEVRNRDAAKLTAVKTSLAASLRKLDQAQRAMQARDEDVAACTSALDRML